MTISIVNLRGGAQRDVESFLLDNDAFPVLENAYLFRGRIQKRSCFTQVGGGQGRLRWQIGTTGASPFTFTLADIPITAGIAQFSIGNEIFTDPGGASPVNLLSTNSAGGYTGTLNRTTGALSLSHPAIAATAVYYYPGLPVMGLPTREQDDINDELLVGFDTRYSYLMDSGTNDFLGANTYKFEAPAVSGPVFTWHGTNSDFFWATNYFGSMFATNNVPGLNAFTISAGTDAIPSVITIGAGHNIQVNDIVMILNTSTGNTLNGRTFQVDVVAGGDITINNTVAPGGGAFNSGYVVVMNRQAATTGAAVVTNGDGIKWYDGPGAGTGWVNFTPPLNSETPERVLRGALIVLPYKGRLLVLNTYESTGTGLAINFGQRARWSQVGTPYFTEDNAATPIEYLLPTNQSANFDAWFDEVPGKGGFLDAPTNEVIVSAEFIKDTLIIYFERSTWQLIYTGNETFPFYFQKINTELGAESTFSKIPFDKGVLSVGNYGITTCDSVNITRIDQKIPDEVFQIQNKNNGVKRVQGIRDYNAQLAYWTYPILVDEDNEAPTYELTYPNQVLIYNYLDGSWAEFDDSFTCFGYFQQFSDITWGALSRSWESTNFSWNSQVLQARYPDVVAGNQRGFVVIFSQLKQLGQNSPSMTISDITVATHTIYAPNHNFVPNQYLLITGVQGTTGINNSIYKILSTTVDNIVLDQLGTLPWTGAYTGGGVITHIPNIYIQTKEFNPQFGNGKSLNIHYMDIFMDRTDEGQISTEVYVSDNSDQPIYSAPFVVSTIPETNFQANQDKIWHRVYINSFGSFIQNVFTLSEAQIKDIDIATSNIKLHGLVYYIEPSGRLAYEF